VVAFLILWVRAVTSVNSGASILTVIFLGYLRDRIEFAKPVTTFKHRLRDKMLDTIVMKEQGTDIRAAA
jgi:hypothetical protein